MRKFIIFTIIFCFLFIPIQANPPRVGSPSRVEAGFPDDLPGPEIMPDSPFYFLKLFWEKVVLFFTFGAAKKAEKYTTFAEKRIYEAKEMLEQGKDELAEKAKETYRKYLNKALDKLETETQKAIKYRSEEAQREAERKVEEIKNKLKNSADL